jgi:hypothetical protein
MSEIIRKLEALSRYYKMHSFFSSGRASDHASELLFWSAVYALTVFLTEKVLGCLSKIKNDKLHEIKLTVPNNLPSRR